MALDPFGKDFNVVPIAAGTLLSMKDCAGYVFVMTGNDTFTLKTAATQNGSTTPLAVISDYKTCTSTSGAAAWVDVTQAAASTVTIASGAAKIYVDGEDMPSNASYVEVSAASGGLVTAIPCGLLVQRAPENLRVLSGASS